ncbi:MAG: tyrosine-type recombinase/integrase [Thermohalobaculum sp.]
MPKELHNALAATKVSKTKEPGRYADGNGLYLVVSDTGGKWWQWRGTVHGRRKELGIGPVRLIELKEAREIARSWRRIAREGGDPRAVRDRAKLQSLTLEEAARRVWAEQVDGQGRNKKYERQWLADLERHVFPAIGRIPVHALSQPDVLAMLAKIWTELPSTARRIKQRLRIVMDWAKTAGHRDDLNPVLGVEGGLPKRRPKPKHFDALPYTELPDAMRCLADLDSVPAMALRFLILTAARSIEVRAAKWSEVDTDARLWAIPAERMKAGEPHRVPLSDAALVVLERIRGLNAQMIFPARKRGAIMHDQTLSAPMKQLGLAATVHGFRSSFRDWCSERTLFPREIAEISLAHQVGDAVERAYARSDILDKRRDLMDQWGRFCLSAGSKGDVVELRR